MNTNISNTNETFLPDNYSLPTSGGNWLKLESGATRLRILTRPVTGWVEFIDNLPVRYKEKPAQAHNSNEPAKHFWMMLVWIDDHQRMQLWEVTQSTVQQAIRDLSQDPDWGSPLGYDLRLTKTGEMLQTRYTVTPLPKSDIPQQAMDETQKRPCNLEAVFTPGKDPFELPVRVPMAESPTEAPAVQLAVNDLPPDFTETDIQQSANNN